MIYDSIIIGAGSAGLSYASLLAKNGKRVLVVEKNKYLGGRAAFRKASEWNFSKDSTLVGYGPHIVPAKCFLEHLTNILGVRNSLHLRKLRMPSIYDENQRRVLYVSNYFGFYDLLRMFHDFKHIKFKEVFGFIRLMMIARRNSYEQLIEKYSSISVADLARKYKLESDNLKGILMMIIESSVLSTDLMDCPALDLLIMIKLMLNGLFKARTIMYEPMDGYGALYDSFKNLILENSGEILFGKNVQKLIVANQNIKGIVLDGKKLFAKEVVFTGVPTAFKKLLDSSKLKSDFLKETITLKPAKIYDLVFLSKTKVHDHKTNWMYLVLNSYNDLKLAPVLIEESAGLNNQYLYYYCFSYDESIPVKNIVDVLTLRLKKIFGYEFEKDVIWSSLKKMDVCGARKSILLPYEKRLGPETEYKNLYLIGDSYKSLTTGTDGCAFAALNLAEKNLEKDFGLDKVF